jgi:hypothetical protein
MFFDDSFSLVGTVAAATVRTFSSERQRPDGAILPYQANNLVDSKVYKKRRAPVSRGACEF